MYDMELDDVCLSSLHHNLVERYVSSATAHNTFASPPPPAALLGQACAYNVLLTAYY